MRVGIAGLGKMGSVFADRIKGSGHELSVWNRTPEKAQAVAGSLLNLRPVLSVEGGEVVAVARVRGKQKAVAEFERRFVEATTDGPGLRIAIAHADAEEWVGTLSELVWRVRPGAEIEFTSTLGAVVGTHAGPGAVGFFWFQDAD